MQISCEKDVERVFGAWSGDSAVVQTPGEGNAEARALAGASSPAGQASCDVDSA